MLRDDLLQQLTETRNVPLTVTELEQETALRLLPRDLEGLVEGRIRRQHTERAIEDEERPAYGLADRIGVLPCVPRASEPPLGLTATHEQHDAAADLEAVRPVR